MDFVQIMCDKKVDQLKCCLQISGIGNAEENIKFCCMKATCLLFVIHNFRSHHTRYVYYIWYYSSIFYWMYFKCNFFYSFAELAWCLFVSFRLWTCLYLCILFVQTKRQYGCECYSSFIVCSETGELLLFSAFDQINCERYML